MPGCPKTVPNRLWICFVQPVRDADEIVLGVIDAELSLNDISQFLDPLQVGRTGRAFVMDRKGHLIAASISTPVADTEHKRLSASDSANRHVSAAAKYIRRESASLEAIVAPFQLSPVVEEEPYLLMISPFLPLSFFDVRCY